MGLRITSNLKDSGYHTSYVEIHPAGIEKLNAMGIQTSPADEVLPACGIAILAIPDVSFESVGQEIIPQLSSGTMVVTLDPAATLASKLLMREDLSYFVAHPSHPSIFNWEPTEEAYRDFFGGIAAKQTIVCALVQGTDEDYQAGEALACKMYEPVSRAHRITVEQMGILEPGLVETLSSTCLTVIRQGLDEAIKMGVPEKAATDFLLGHITIQLAVLFDQIPGAVFSDAANKAIDNAMGLIFKEDWKKVLSAESVKQQIEAIT
ncbi:MAG: semialdehyde dehydrogenase [Desulfobacterales bacterium]|nr:semialdehyde dehydrogenase [Desulfobacterales bacterium]